MDKDKLIRYHRRRIRREEWVNNLLDNARIMQYKLRPNLTELESRLKIVKDLRERAEARLNYLKDPTCRKLIDQIKACANQIETIRANRESLKALSIIPTLTSSATTQIAVKIKEEEMAIFNGLAAEQELQKVCRNEHYLVADSRVSKVLKP